MDFVLALHSHLPYVLNHGRWPHGSDWLCEAALDSYLPLLEQLQERAAPPHGTRAPVTIGFTPVLANQLASPAFAQELEAFFDQREAVCREAPAALAATGDGALLPLVDYWKARLSRLRKLFQAVERDIVAAFRRLQADAHLARAGTPLGMYSEIPLGAERFDAERHEAASKPAAAAVRSPYQVYRVTPPRAKRSVATLVRDPRSSMQVWSRHQGYPGDEWYLEFHKIRWPGGLKLWRVTGPDVDLGAKRAYDPAAARGRAGDHARHFAHLLGEIAAEPAAGGAKDGGVVVAPFDTELFGHWWFEGVDFLAAVYRELRYHPRIRAATGSQHLADHPPRAALRLAEGSWGVNGDHTMWLNDRTAWTWPRLRALEGAF